MTEFLQLTFIASLWIWGVFAAFDEGNLLWFARNNFEKTGGMWLAKPLFSCPYCMSSVHGGTIGFIYYGFDYRVIGLMLCVCGLNFIIKEYLYG